MEIVFGEVIVSGEYPEAQSAEVLIDICTPFEDGEKLAVLRPADLAEIMRGNRKYYCQRCFGKTTIRNNVMCKDDKNRVERYEYLPCEECKHVGLNLSLPICAQVAEAMKGE